MKRQSAHVFIGIVVLFSTGLLANEIAIQPTADEAFFQQVDVAGIRLGMTPAEVSRIVKSQEDIPLYREQTAWLDEPEKEGQFIEQIVATSRNEHSYDDKDELVVYFTPVPGKERVCRVIRKKFYGDEPAAVETLVKAMTEKFGATTATMANGSERAFLLWNLSNRTKASSSICTYDSLGPRSHCGPANLTATIVYKDREKKIARGYGLSLQSELLSEAGESFRTEWKKARQDRKQAEQLEDAKKRNVKSGL